MIWGSIKLIFYWFNFMKLHNMTAIFTNTVKIQDSIYYDLGCMMNRINLVTLVKITDILSINLLKIK